MDIHDQETALITPPNKPPPRLRGFTNNRRSTADQQYSRLNRSTPKAGKSNSRGRAATDTESTYYITPDHDNDDRVPFYGEFNEEHTKVPYIGESESQVYTDPHYGAESDIHLQQQRKQQAFVRSSSLELQSDEEGKCAREGASTINAVNQMARSQHKYQNCVPRGNYDNAVLSSTSEDVTESTPYYQEIIATRELKTDYTTANILESPAL